MATKARRPRPGGRATRRPPRWRPWLIGGALALVAVAAVAILLLRGPDGGLAAERTRHDFGPVPINGGAVIARFPLTAGAPVRVVDLGTT
jgi:hypothetical protein